MSEFRVLTKVTIINYFTFILEVGWERVNGN